MARRHMKICKRADGFTLVEMAVVVIIIGLLMIPVIQGYDIWQTQKRFDVTRENISTMQTSILSYVARNNRYPCPANPSLPASDPAFGQEIRAADGSCAMSALSVGTCQADSDQSLCKVTSERRIPVGNPNPEPVLMGMLPIVTLALNAAADNVELTTMEALDGWNNRLTYAVTESTTLTAYDKNRGAVVVMANNDMDITGKDVGSGEAPTYMHYALISHGQDGIGARSAAGASLSLCATGIYGAPDGPPADADNPAGSYSKVDIHNCNMDGTFRSNLFNLTAGRAHFDDIIAFGSTATTDFWRYIQNGDGEITPNIENTNVGFIGIQTVEPQTQLDVNGALRAETQVRSPTFCDRNGTNCFETQALTQNNSTAPSLANEGSNKSVGIKCSSGRAMVGISKGDEMCGDVKINSVRAQSCGANMVLKSIDTNGTIFCESIVSN